MRFKHLRERSFWQACQLSSARMSGLKEVGEIYMQRVKYIYAETCSVEIYNSIANYWKIKNMQHLTSWTPYKQAIWKVCVTFDFIFCIISWEKNIATKLCGFIWPFCSLRFKKCVDICFQSIVGDIRIFSKFEPCVTFWLPSKNALELQISSFLVFSNLSIITQVKCGIIISIQ